MSFWGTFRSFLGSNAAGAPPEERLIKRIRCKRCGSLDVWRVQADGGWYSEWMKSRQKKPFECRMCKHKFYYHALRNPD